MVANVRLWGLAEILKSLIVNRVIVQGMTWFDCYSLLSCRTGNSKAIEAEKLGG